MLPRLCIKRLLRVPIVRLERNVRYGIISKGFISIAEHKRCTITPASRYNDHCKQQIRIFSSNTDRITGALTPLTYEQVCNDTLESLSDYFEQLVEEASHLKTADISYSDGVLTVQFGSPHGTYVINRQSPNLQIWLSSPRSGPKRYDFQDGHWVYRHDGVSLHELLNQEIPCIVDQNVDFFHCAYSQKQ